MSYHQKGRACILCMKFEEKPKKKTIKNKKKQILKNPKNPLKTLKSLKIVNTKKTPKTVLKQKPKDFLHKYFVGKD